MREATRTVATVLFVEPELRTDKLGFMYLGSVLKEAGHTVGLVQCYGEMFLGYAVEQLFKPDFLAYSVTSGNHEWYLKTNREAKKKWPDIISIMGGPHFTFYPEDGEDDDTIDYVVQGPGEDVICDIVEGKISDKMIIGRPSSTLTEIRPYWDMLYKYPRFGDSPIKRFIAGRSCPHACTYCFNHMYNTMYMDCREYWLQMVDPEEMVERINFVRDIWGLQLAYFNDDNLVRSQAWIENFCEYKYYDWEFCGSVRADSMTEEITGMLAVYGCTFLNIALESSVPETQKILRRGKVTNQDVVNACRWCAENGIKVRLQNMIGLPVDNPLEDALETLRFNIEHGDFITDSWCAILQPFKKTDIWKLCIEKGLIDKNTQAKTFYDSTILNIPDAERINRLAKWWHIAVREKLPIDIVRKLIDIPLTNTQKKAMQQVRWQNAAEILYGMVRWT
jgi:radical SAM superfamily enzyme YgiQ (UPF0313 family)